MSNNTNLRNAKKAKNDEFYTRIEDIENELKYYMDFFKDKVVYCNCDRAEGENQSNFFVYFTKYFNKLGLKRLICTTYNKSGKGRLCIYDGETDGHNIIDMDGDGDFRSEECVKWLKKSDVVVTNPPFSLFRDFVAQLVRYDKKFLIIGNMNAITYKDIFPLIKDNKIWLGMSAPKAYSTPLNGVENEKTQYEKDGIVYQKFGNHGWFTNIPHSKRNFPLDLYKKYNPNEYPKYDNYDAINVNKTKDIPMDYDGVIGVPISFLDKYCPTQFEIVKFCKGDDDKNLYISGHKQLYFRILIRKIK